MTTRFVHFTDLHIANPDVTEPHYHSDTGATLTRVLETLRTIEPRPSFVVLSGDIANNADPAAYRELKRLWGDFDLPALYSLGNHDSRTAFRTEFLGVTDGDLEAPYFYDRVIDGIHVVVLDSSTPRQIHGTIEPEQFAWLEQVLATHTNLPKVVVSHHPPAFSEEHVRHPFESIGYADSQRLATLLKNRNVIAILSGHVHHDCVAMWHGIPVVISNGHHSTSDVLHRGGLRAMEGAGFALLTLRESGLSVNFLPVLPERREVSRTSLEQLQRYIDALQAQAAE